jgi:hypothetical protein
LATSRRRRETGAACITSPIASHGKLDARNGSEHV